VGKVIGAGSFGVVREAVQRGTGIRYAVKSVPKMPKRGVPTPRYLLKLRQEVDAMQQLGASLDAVYLAVRFESLPRETIGTMKCCNYLACEGDVACYSAEYLQCAAS
jgi:serine/threonine protein kinase